ENKGKNDCKTETAFGVTKRQKVESTGPQGEYPIWAAARVQVLKGPVIPCRPRTKIPMVKGWSKNLEAGPGQLRTVEQVDAFWSENPTANLAIMPHEYGWGVVECDTYKEGCEAEKLNLPDTGTIRSPRGGLHKYYVGVLPPMQNNELAKHVDT